MKDDYYGPNTSFTSFKEIFSWFFVRFLFALFLCSLASLTLIFMFGSVAIAIWLFFFLFS